jgi:hypothetical protein
VEQLTYHSQWRLRISTYSNGNSHWLNMNRRTKNYTDGTLHCNVPNSNFIFSRCMLVCCWNVLTTFSWRAIRRQIKWIPILHRIESIDHDGRIMRTIRRKLESLDITDTNYRGRLTMTLFNTSAGEPYVLPFTSEHPRRINRNIIKGALYHTMRLRSNFDYFDKQDTTFTTWFIDDEP